MKHRTTNLIFVANPQWRSEFSRLGRFMAVGLSSTLLDFTILTALKFFFGWATLPANLVSYSCGTINSYLLNRFWVYPQARQKQAHVQLLQFIIINLIGLVLNNLLVLALEGPLGRLLSNEDNGYLPAKLIAAGIVLVWNFFANRLWTFNQTGLNSLSLKTPEKQAELYKRPAA